MKGDDGRVEDAPGKDDVRMQRAVKCVVTMKERTARLIRQVCSVPDLLQLYIDQFGVTLKTEGRFVVSLFQARLLPPGEKRSLLPEVPYIYSSLVMPSDNPVHNVRMN